jgi:hypothetical protein
LQDVDVALSAFARAWRARDYTAARTALRQVNDTTLSFRLEQLVVFGEARTATETNNTARACRLASQLEPGVKRALIFAAISGQLRGRWASRSSWLQIALNDAETLPERQKRALLSVLLPIVLDVDARRGLRLLDDAIHDQPRESVFTSAERIALPKYATEIIANGSLLLERVRGSATKQVFILSGSGFRASDLRDLALTHHARLRCRQLRDSHLVTGGSTQARELRLVRARSAERPFAMEAIRVTKHAGPGAVPGRFRAGAVRHQQVDAIVK